MPRNPRARGSCQDVLFLLVAFISVYFAAFIRATLEALDNHPFDSTSSSVVSVVVGRQEHHYTDSAHERFVHGLLTAYVTTAQTSNSLCCIPGVSFTSPIRVWMYAHNYHLIVQGTGHHAGCWDTQSKFISCFPALPVDSDVPFAATAYS